jgi:hypothetical protein
VHFVYVAIYIALDNLFHVQLFLASLMIIEIEMADVGLWECQKKNFLSRCDREGRLFLQKICHVPRVEVRKLLVLSAIVTILLLRT